MFARFPLFSFFVLACAISWIIWAPLWLDALGVEGMPDIPFNHALGAYGPLAAAFIVSGRAGAGDLLRRMVAWRGRETPILVALLLPLALLLIALLVAFLLGGDIPAAGDLGVSDEFVEFNALVFLIYNIVTFGIGEEVGWRGFALPHLQARFNALIATVVLTVGWAIWHLPLFLYRPGYVDMGLAGAAGWFVSLLASAMILTWLYNTGRGSILVVALFHAAIDVAFTSVDVSPLITNAEGILITLVGIGVIVATGPVMLSRAGRMVWTGVTQETRT